MEAAVQNVVNELKASRDEEPIKSIQKYLTNNNYRSLVAFSLIFMFSLVFYLIYLLVDVFIDKQKHYELCVKSFERYEKRCRAKKAKQQEQQPNDLERLDDQQIKQHIDEMVGVEEADEQEKREALSRQTKLAFTEWSMRNLQISFIHSVLSSLWLIRIAIVRYEPLFGDLLFYVSWDTYLLVAFSSGYFLYDFYDIYANGYVRREWVVCAHHVIVLVSFSYHMCALQSVGYTCLALAMEFNSVFLHARKLLSFYMFGKRSLPYLVNCACNVTTFVLFRFGVLAYIYYGVYTDGHRVHWAYIVGLVTLVTLMAIINVFLFERVVKRDVLPLICGPKQSSSSHSSIKHKSKGKRKKSKKLADDELVHAATIDEKALIVDPQLLSSENLPIINNGQSNVVLVMVE